MKILHLVLFLILSVVQPACAQDSSAYDNIEIDAYLKNLNTVFISGHPYQWMTENMIHNRIDLKYSHDNGFSFQAGLRTRFIYGEFVKNFLSYSSLIDTEKGWLDMSWLVVNNKFFLLHSVIDRLFFDWNKGKIVLRIGRQRINWSQTFVWNPNDIFNAYNFFDFDYEIKPGSDAIKISYYSGALSQLEAAIKIDYQNRLTAASMFRFNRWNYDFQIISGIMNDEELVAGGGWSGQILKGGFRNETSIFFNTRQDDSVFTVLSSTGYEYVFKNNLMLMAEVLYNSNGMRKGFFKLDEFYYNDLNAKTLSLTRWTFMLMTSYPVNPLLNCSFSAMYSLNNQFLFLGPSVTYSATDNLSFTLNTQAFFSIKENDNTGGFVFLVFKWGI